MPLKDVSKMIFLGIVRRCDMEEQGHRRMGMLVAAEETGVIMSLFVYTKVSFSRGDFFVALPFPLCPERLLLHFTLLRLRVSLRSLTSLVSDLIFSNLHQFQLLVN